MVSTDYVLTLARREDIPFVLAMRTSLNNVGGAACTVVVGCLDATASQALAALSPAGIVSRTVPEPEAEAQAYRLLTQDASPKARILICRPRVWFAESPRHYLAGVKKGVLFNTGPFVGAFADPESFGDWLDGTAQIDFEPTPAVKPWEPKGAVAWDYSGADVVMHYVFVADRDTRSPLTFNLFRERFLPVAEEVLRMAHACRAATPDWHAAPSPPQWLGPEHALVVLERHPSSIFHIPLFGVRLGGAIAYLPASMRGTESFAQAGAQIPLPLDPQFPNDDPAAKALALAQQGEESALDALDSVLSINRHDWRAVHALCRMLMGAGRIDDVLEVTEYHLDAYPDDKVVRAVRNKAQETELMELFSTCSVSESERDSFEPLVSVLVSTYASEAFMEECLTDLAGQTIADKLEVIIVDAASPEDERSIVARWQQDHPELHIRYVRTPERIGIYRAWNLAAYLARGRYMTPFSTNDRLALDAYEALADTLESDVDSMLVYGNTKLTDNPHETFTDHTPSERGEEWVWPEYSFEYNLASCTVGPHPMWRSEAITRFGYFDERYKALADQDFFLRIGRIIRLTHIEKFTGLAWLSESALSDETKTQKELVHIRNRFLHHHVRDMVELTVFSRFVASLDPLLASGRLVAAKALLAPVRHRLPQTDLVRQLESALFGA